MTYHDDGFHYQPGGDLTESFHTYGVEWQPNRIVHFVDGQPIQEWTNPRLLAAMGCWCAVLYDVLTGYQSHR